MLLQQLMRLANMPFSRTVRTLRPCSRNIFLILLILQWLRLKAALISATSVSRHHSTVSPCRLSLELFLLVIIIGRSHHGPRIVVPASPILFRPLAVLSFSIPAIRSRGQSAASPSATLPQHRLFARVVSSAFIPRLPAVVMTRIPLFPSHLLVCIPPVRQAHCGREYSRDLLCS